MRSMYFLWVLVGCIAASVWAAGLHCAFGYRLALCSTFCKYVHCDRLNAFHSFEIVKGIVCIMNTVNGKKKQTQTREGKHAHTHTLSARNTRCGHMAKLNAIPPFAYIVFIDHVVVSGANSTLAVTLKMQFNGCCCCFVALNANEDKQNSNAMHGSNFGFVFSCCWTITRMDGWMMRIAFPKIDGFSLLTEKYIIEFQILAGKMQHS